MEKLSKAVLPVAGLGTRFLPASKSIPKEMVTVVDKPAIQYVVDEAIAAGIREIVLVNHASKPAIENYFDVNYELESTLEKKGKTALLQALRDIVPDDVRVISVRQGRPLGLGHAVMCAREVIGDQPFAVMLPDVLVDNYGQDETDLARMITRYQETGVSQIMVEAVPQDRVDQYGVVALGDEFPEAGHSKPMVGIVEKPKPEEAPSNLSVVGRYVLPARIFELLKNTAPGAGNEIQLTDAIAELMNEQSIEAYQMRGSTYDCGSKAGYLEATLQYGIRHPELGSGFRNAMRNLLSDQ
ncbi:UTP--glucose-1-phosphate uridylyltransferase GalU [Alloalcanivorax xenomutans]|uniref:UTP--glucose-1-phosphate uridylyltransferase GalU n=1 Tax=Alloalcanivorax xenomutans TaxID=1094342 RepID=UPI0009B6129C|nr:UTP--glucose-1-phosphate uridylyltransferase GalU [Alloalcanivorax xenomutans]ARB45404.1 nucleotidyl transferase [Alloalcanivorax xenomutans]